MLFLIDARNPFASLPFCFSAARSKFREAFIGCDGPYSKDAIGWSLASSKANQACANLLQGSQDATSSSADGTFSSFTPERRISRLDPFATVSRKKLALVVLTFQTSVGQVSSIPLSSTNVSSASNGSSIPPEGDVETGKCGQRGSDYNKTVEGEAVYCRKTDGSYIFQWVSMLVADHPGVGGLNRVL